MSTTELDIRRMALEEAAVSICGYCQGSKGHDPLPSKMLDGSWHHLFAVGNGSNECAAGPIWTMVVRTKTLREEARRAAIAATEPKS